MRFGIGARLGVLASVLIIATGGILFFWITRWSRSALQHQGHSHLADETLLHAEELGNALRDLREQATRLASCPEIQDWLRAPPFQRKALLERMKKTAQETLKAHAGLLRLEFLPSEDGGRDSLQVGRPGVHFGPGNVLDRYFPGLRLTTDRTPRLAPVHRNDDVRLANQAVPVCRAAVPLLVPATDGSHRNAGAVVVTRDFSPLAHYLSRDVRMLVYLTDEQGRFLVHPEPDRAFAFEKDRTAPRIQDVLPALEPLYQPGSDAGDDLLGADGRPRGKRFNYPLTDGPWKSPKPWFLMSLQIKDPAAWAANEELRRQVKDDLTELPPGGDNLASSLHEAHDPEILLRGLDRARLQCEGDALARRFSADLGSPSLRECRTFAVQFVRLDVAPGRWFGLAQGLSYEDLDAAISAPENRLVLWGKFLALIAGGVLLAFVLARRLTRPLQQITEATRELAQGNFAVNLEMKNASHEIDELARCFRDMAEQLQITMQQKREEEARLKTVLRTAAEGIFILDDEGRIQLVNQAALRIFGYAERELEGQDVKVLIPRAVQGLPVPVRAESPSALESIRLGKINNSTHEIVGQRKDGSTFPLELSVSDVAVGTRRVFTGIVRDVTERKRAEKEIRDLNGHLLQLNEQLDNRVQERTRQLQQANTDLSVARDHALEASRVKSAFLAQMSHEFRTPLNHVKGYAELLREELQERGLGQLLPDIDRVLASCQHLLYLVGDVLDLSSIEAREVELHLESFELRGLIDELTAGVQSRIEANGNTLAVRASQSLGRMYADRSRVRLVLWNLLGNAAKFTRNGTIELTVSHETRRGREWFQFQVTDTGIGIPAEQLAKLFRPFSQGDNSTTRRHDGSGLGLIISRSFCRMMGGDVSVTSEPGSGSTFTVLLPVQVLDAQPGNAPAALVIGNEPGLSELLAALEQEGFRSVVTANGLEAQRLARRLEPSLVVLDGGLNGENVWDGLAALKTDSATARTPVLVLTRGDDRALALAHGAAEHLTWPLDRLALARVLERHRAGVETAVRIRHAPRS